MSGLSPRQRQQFSEATQLGLLCLIVVLQREVAAPLTGKFGIPFRDFLLQSFNGISGAD
jgi:hypothetical protein